MNIHHTQLFKNHVVCPMHDVVMHSANELYHITNTQKTKVWLVGAAGFCMFDCDLFLVRAMHDCHA